MVYKVNNTDTVKSLFDGWEETLIWSCLDGTMGSIYATDMNRPVSAMAVIGDFVFYAGVPDGELISYKPEGYKKDFMIMVPQSEGWSALIEQCCGEKAKAVLRYAMKKEKGIFDQEKLLRAVSGLPDVYELCPIDEKLYNLCRAEGWSRDLVSQFKDYETYRKAGLGFVILENDQIVSGASSYTRYRDGIEIEIDTRREYRRRGLAYVCGAKLILECLERNLHPSWDAQNVWSVALAEKLGYHFSHEYRAYEVCPFGHPATYALRA